MIPAAIGALWETFHASDIRTKIGADASENVYCVYHDYEGGFTGPYRMTIGYRASAADPQPQSLISQWQAIWNSDLNRSYLADYDVYYATDPGAVSIRVGVRS